MGAGLHENMPSLQTFSVVVRPSTTLQLVSYTSPCEFKTGQPYYVFIHGAVPRWSSICRKAEIRKLTSRNSIAEVPHMADTIVEAGTDGTDASGRGQDGENNELGGRRLHSEIGEWRLR